MDVDLLTLAERCIDDVEDRDHLHVGGDAEVADRHAHVLDTRGQAIGVRRQFSLLGQVDEQRRAVDQLARPSGTVRSAASRGRELAPQADEERLQGELRLEVELLEPAPRLPHELRRALGGRAAARPTPSSRSVSRWS